MLTTADVNIHALIAKYGIDIQIVRPEMTKFKMFRVKVNMDFYTGATLLQLKIGPTSDVDKKILQNVFTICAFQK
jgi:hypothetical protein